jgi:hypothetical protein
MRINSCSTERYILVIYRISTNVLHKEWVSSDKQSRKINVFMYLCSSYLKNLLTKSLLHKPRGLKVLGVSRIRPKSYFKTGTNVLELFLKKKKCPRLNIVSRFVNGKNKTFYMHTL